MYFECDEDQRRRFLPDLIAGRKIACTGSTEPDTGSDPRGVKTRVSQDGDELVLNGRKMWRSEEHTSELQSLMRISYAVFCLQIKKHKRNINETITNITN